MSEPSTQHRVWKAAMVVLGTISLATGAFPVPGFWSSYVLDMAGPAWIYILARGLFRPEPPPFSRYLTPEVTVVSCTAVCFLIEGAQYLQLYESHFDPLDLLAYVSILWPVYLVDRWLLIRHAERHSGDWTDDGRHRPRRAE